jgi:glycosyltransferase involved in cell wall biosynthesis
VHVAILIGHFPPGCFGGAELQAESWARLLADRHRVTVITRLDPPSQPARESRDGFQVVRLPLSRLPLWRSIADVAGIGRAVAALEPAPDVLLCFQTWISGFAGVRVGRRLGIPAIVWIRGEEEYHLGRSHKHRLVSLGVWRGARGVLVQSERNRRRMLEEIARHAPRQLDLVGGKLDVVANGLDLPAGPFGPGSGALSVGRLIPAKGMDTVIEAVAARGGALTIAGDGPERATLERLARDRGLECRFEGYASREGLGRLYADAACVVLASRFGEGLPNVLLEAMAHARPVVATPCAGTADLLVDEVNGLLIPPDDAAALAAALDRLERDPALAGRLGAEARRTAERFSWGEVRPRLEAVLDRWARA